VQCVYAAIDEANEDREDLPPLEKALDTELFGPKTGLDSLALINLLVATEEGIERELGAAVVISDDRAFSRSPSPLRTVRTLVEYIEELLAEQD